MGAVEAIWLPALFGGAVAVGATVAIERLGGITGGLLATLPTTIVPASFAILAGSESVEAYQLAMGAVPVGMVMNACFLWTWRLAPPHLPDASLRTQLLWMTALSLAVWALATGISLVGIEALRGLGVGPIPVGGVALGVLVGLGLLASKRGTPAPRGTRRVAAAQLALRGVLAGLFIGLAGALALAGIPVLAGIISVFPAIFLTVMVSLWWSQGPEVPSGAVGPMMLGSASIGVFAMLSAALVPHLGILLATPLAWVSAVIFVTVPASTWFRRRAL